MLYPVNIFLSFLQITKISLVALGLGRRVSTAEIFIESEGDFI
jgi:hypothetical protein